MADVGAGDDLQRAAAHPGLEAQLEVLPAPDVEAGVVAAELLEELPVDGEEAAGHGGAVHWLRLVTPPAHNIRYYLCLSVNCQIMASCI